MTPVIGLVALGAAALLLRQQEPRFGERVDVERVLLDARVLDGRGEPRRDLKPANFRVKVDGRTVPVESAFWVDAATPYAEGLSPERRRDGRSRRSPGRAADRLLLPEGPAPDAHAGPDAHDPRSLAHAGHAPSRRPGGGRVVRQPPEAVDRLHGRPCDRAARHRALRAVRGPGPRDRRGAVPLPGRDVRPDRRAPCGHAREGIARAGGGAPRPSGREVDGVLRVGPGPHVPAGRAHGARLRPRRGGAAGVAHDRVLARRDGRRLSLARGRPPAGRGRHGRVLRAHARLRRGRHEAAAARPPGPLRAGVRAPAAAARRAPRAGGPGGDVRRGAREAGVLVRLGRTESSTRTIQDLASSIRSLGECRWSPR